MESKYYTIITAEKTENIQILWKNRWKMGNEEARINPNTQLKPANFSTVG